MNCLDCLVERALVVPAVGICSDCGAGVCLDHAVLVAHRTEARGYLGRRIPLPRPGRLVRCGLCQAVSEDLSAAPTT